MISPLPAPKYFPNKDMHPHFTDKEAWCNLFVLKHRAKDPELAVSGAEKEHCPPCSPASAKPGEHWVAGWQGGACGQLWALGTLAALKPKFALILQPLDGNTAQLGVLPPCGASHLGITGLWWVMPSLQQQCLTCVWFGACAVFLLHEHAILLLAVGFVTRYLLALLEVIQAGPPR